MIYENLEKFAIGLGCVGITLGVVAVPLATYKLARSIIEAPTSSSVLEYNGENIGKASDIYVLDVSLIDTDIHIKSNNGKNISINRVSENAENYYYFMDTHYADEKNKKDLILSDVFYGNEYMNVYMDEKTEMQNGNYFNSKTNTAISFSNIDENYNLVDILKPMNEFLDYKGLSELKKDNYSIEDIANIKEAVLELEDSKTLKKIMS